LKVLPSKGISAATAQPEVRKWLQEIKLVEDLRRPAQTAPPAAAVLAETKAVTNSIGMEFIVVPAGTQPTNSESDTGHPVI
jgi:hypothetical protein